MDGDNGFPSLLLFTGFEVIDIDAFLLESASQLQGSLH